jgi:hypothetical protein
MEAVETKRIGKYKIEVVQDEMAESPDAWGNDDAFVVYEHRQFDVRREGFAQEADALVQPPGVDDGVPWVARHIENR